eukprot:CAMPEP_0206233408 /NCGR_PEP_ID=MMETSP0047_2-20121206/11974_1 /ASSEMBLY_ACC=CAM_ASM_000192 /TAXON_ID=195065 /ORGANISM="Chroomonas mesostigmatica_cf, Strain CCMP1168" /LENGTH=101 /DNA_ID=CAMNT_0053657291 /DNA_START=186 /DNA_END=488 /DNA_ORIENTATION=+
MTSQAPSLPARTLQQYAHAHAAAEAPSHCAQSPSAEGAGDRSAAHAILIDGNTALRIDLGGFGRRRIVSEQRPLTNAAPNVILIETRETADFLIVVDPGAT